mmetsp:Transcript_6101/g.11727  ORF Transcript_6101/g.11727 Transcript_6101/m.11727 type:complete len:300 (+) Transcript_6101:352-1251(+)
MMTSLSLHSLSYRQPVISSYGYFSSSDDSNAIPQMIAASSLHSYSETESDNDSLSSNTRSMARAQNFESSPRSIFGSYWSSSAHTKSLEGIHGGDEDENEAMASLYAPQLPWTDGDTDREKSSSSADPNKIVRGSIEPKKSYDDNSIEYQAGTLGPNSTRSPRRQILPTPPPSTAISSSLVQPRGKLQFLLSPRTPLGERKSLSTSALLKGPCRSCLRKSRYSCSAIVTRRDAVSTGRLHHQLRNNGSHDLQHHITSPSSILRDELKKSVSFYSQVSVFEFAVPQDQQKSQKGWSKQFA